MGFACRCVVWGRVRGVLMGFACRCDEGGLRWVLPAGVLCGAG